MRAFTKLNYREPRFPEIFPHILTHVKVFELKLEDFNILKANVLLACSDKYATSNLKILRSNQDVTLSNNQKFSDIFIKNYSNDLELHREIVRWSEGI